MRLVLRECYPGCEVRAIRPEQRGAHDEALSLYQLRLR